MAANDELPRGLTLNSLQNGTGVAAQIVFPATPGIAWVLTHVDFTWLQNPSTNTGCFIQVNGEVIGMIALDPSANTGKDSFSWDGDLPFAVGASVTVSSNNGGGLTSQQLLNATAYPV